MLLNIDPMMIPLLHSETVFLSPLKMPTGTAASRDRRSSDQIYYNAEKNSISQLSNEPGTKFLTLQIPSIAAKKFSER